MLLACIVLCPPQPAEIRIPGQAALGVAARLPASHCPPSRCGAGWQALRVQRGRAVARSSSTTSAGRGPVDAADSKRRHPKLRSASGICRAPLIAFRRWHHSAWIVVTESLQARCVRLSAYHNNRGVRWRAEALASLCQGVRALAGIEVPI
jgi:hypothetical protein